MLFFRSEDEVSAWCETHGLPQRPVVTMDQLWALSTTWYENRLEADSRRPKPEEIPGIFAAVGLTDDSWNPLSGSNV